MANNTCGTCKNLCRTAADFEQRGQKRLCAALKIYVREESKQCEEYQRMPDEADRGKTVGKSKSE